MPFAIKMRITADTVIPFCYSLICYFISLVSLTYFIVFSSGIYGPISINSQNSEQPFMISLLFNISLIVLFGLQHSIMARKSFKQWLLKYLPESVERSTFCLGSSIVLAMIAYFWVPMNGDVWKLTDELSAIFIYAISGSGWILMLIATFQLDHFELFGLKQTYFPLLGKTMTAAEFKMPGLYKIVRHPIQLGVIIGIWTVPESTVNHIILAISMSIYIIIGLYFEEKSLIKEFGKRYRDYKKQVAKLLPFVG